MYSRSIYPYVLVIGILLAGCGDSSTPESNQDTRPFYMGFTPWPYDFTEAAQQEVYSLINLNGDMIGHHFDEGVPWNEALNSQPYTQHMLDNIAHRLSNTDADKKVYLALTPLSSRNRRELALYWGDETNQDLPADWASRSFDHDDVILAYTNFCKFMIGQFDPDYFNFGIEVSGQWANTSESEFQALLVLLEETYTELKSSYPNLPIFVSIQADPSDGDRTTVSDHLEVSRACLQYSDYVAISSYPYLGSTGSTANPALLEASYFTELKNLASGKPFAIAETGYIAETLSVYDGAAVVEGREDWQNQYLEFMLEELDQLDTEFVIWFLIQDYDDGWETLEALGFDDLFKVWKDTGLIDGNGNTRTSLETWQNWLDRVVETN